MITEVDLALAVTMMEIDDWKLDRDRQSVANKGSPDFHGANITCVMDASAHSLLS